MYVKNIRAQSRPILMIWIKLVLGVAPFTKVKKESSAKRDGGTTGIWVWDMWKNTCSYHSGY